ncbi:MAG TPA: ATP-binding cassette domain-containing protein [Candidatus Thiothrix moscowensis]|uniref:ABC transporter ATP-binding protein n=1 Tax=unclassified Thiothrix TaxID=2636184 RepID=UPI0025EC509B|nr:MULTISPECIES: ATP-binding cassette domain-containing protein [unclassified Thiothrix]HRJ53834.1 ATP-binding cassette domain-containing protein [Candidatus Thiothrix moscowensis]HRJ93916.1 ATP-binding cassette domain-containing protein [Candidatus Thiothrix moscowensis]
MGTLISIRNLTNQFGTQRVHDGLNLDIMQGEVLGIVGGSGSGKSVLLRTILGLNRPHSGEIHFGGQELMSMPDKDFACLKRRWGVMFQKGALFSSLTVADNIRFPLREFSSLTETEARELMYVRLAMVGLERDVARKYPAQLSGGMVKRVSLARALVLDPVVLFLDEPTSGLDPVSAEEFDQLIATLHRNLGLTVVMVTHDLDSLFSTCDRIAMLVDKQVIAGSLRELLANPHPVIQQYFGGGRAQVLLREH